MKTRNLGLVAGALVLLAFSVSPSGCQDNGGSGGSDSSNTNSGASGAQGGDGGSGAGSGNNGGSGGGGQQETECTDGQDNDGDDYIDCDDLDCEGTVACPGLVENSNTLCGDNIDNDEDGLTDCLDDSCHGHPAVTSCQEAYADCDDTLDNDSDGYADCEDRDCQVAAEANNAPGALGVCWNDPNDNIEAGDDECSNGSDDDGDMCNINMMMVPCADCNDFSCQDSVQACSENTTAECTNTPIDENNNSFVDCDDFSCQEQGLCPESTDAECSDGMDNADTDDFVDCADFSCQRSHVVTVCDGNAVSCADGIDNDGNGFNGCEDFSCRCCPGEGDPCSNQRVVSTCAPCTQ